MLKFLLKLLNKPQIGTGALLDTRTDAEKESDIHFNEVVSAAVAVTYTEMLPSDVRQFPIQNQGGASDCVAQTRRKLARIIYKVNKNYDVDFAEGYIYRKRSNYPGQGMGADDAIKIANTGMLVRTVLPTDNFTEDQLNSLKLDAWMDDLAKVFATPKDIIFTPGDLDTPAGTIQVTRKGIMTWFYFTAEEWAREVPTVIDMTLTKDDTRSLRHSVTAVEPAKYNGIEGVWIEDSAWFGGLNRRFITRDFYQKRNFYASYPKNFNFAEAQGTKPHYIAGNIVSLQDCLKYEGVFPVNQDSTGVFGAITKKAVIDFQIKYGLNPPLGNVGPLTVAKLKELYP